MAVYLDGEKSCSYFNSLIIIFNFYKPFQRIININIRFYVKYLYISYGILVGILCFGTHYIGGGKAGDNKGFFKEFIIIKGR